MMRAPDLYRPVAGSLASDGCVGNVVKQSQKFVNWPQQGVANSPPSLSLEILDQPGVISKDPKQQSQQFPHDQLSIHQSSGCMNLDFDVQDSSQDCSCSINSIDLHSSGSIIIQQQHPSSVPIQAHYTSFQFDPIPQSSKQHQQPQNSSHIDVNLAQSHHIISPQDNIDGTQTDHKKVLQAELPVRDARAQVTGALPAHSHHNPNQHRQQSLQRHQTFQMAPPPAPFLGQSIYTATSDTITDTSLGRKNDIQVGKFYHRAKPDASPSFADPPSKPNLLPACTTQNQHQHRHPSHHFTHHLHHFNSEPNQGSTFQQQQLNYRNTIARIPSSDQDRSVMTLSKPPCRAKVNQRQMSVAFKMGPRVKSLDCPEYERFNRPDQACSREMPSMTNLRPKDPNLVSKGRSSSHVRGTQGNSIKNTHLNGDKSVTKTTVPPLSSVGANNSVNNSSANDAQVVMASHQQQQRKSNSNNASNSSNNMNNNPNITGLPFQTPQEMSQNFSFTNQQTALHHQSGSLRSPFSPIAGTPVVTSHRTRNSWMRISSIICIPVGMIIVVFIVVSPLFHYMM